MRGWTDLTYAVAGAAVACAVAGSVVLGMRLAKLIRRWRAKNPDEVEKLRRLHVNDHGRIVSAEIVDVIENGPPENVNRVLVYRYQVAGVTYEAAQEISRIPGIVLLADGLSGVESNVKYDPRRPANSIIACEEWSGLKPRKPAATVTNGMSDE